ncbi:MAG: hypothetical protein ACREYA_10430 [Cupriavidus necator]
MGKLDGNAWQINCSEAKTGVTCMTRALSSEWGRLKPGANALADRRIHSRLTIADANVGAITDIEGCRTRIGVSPALLQSHAQRRPIGRTGTRDEADGAVSLFCSPESSNISGQTVVAAGWQQ